MLKRLRGGPQKEPSNDPEEPRGFSQSRVARTIHAIRLREVARTLVRAPLLLAVLTVALLAADVRGQSDPKTERARELFIEGITAYDGGRYEEARTKFLAAYAIKRHPAVLLNLGQSELKAGYVEDGGNHLQQFLREHKSATADQTKAAKDGIQDAQKRTAFIILIVDLDGAALAVDGVTIGRSPLLDPYFLKPGQHEATATHDGKMAKQQFDAKKGTATPVSLSISGAPVAPPPAPTATGDTNGSSGGPPPPAPTATGYPPPGPLGPQPPPMGPMPPGDTGVTGKREDPIAWFQRKPLAWVGAGLTGLGLIGSIAFGAAAAGASSAADDVAAKILEHAATTGDLEGTSYDTNPPTPCGTRDGSKPPHNNYKDACGSLADNLETYDLDIALMATSIVIGVLAAGGTVAYYFVDTKPTTSGARKPPRRQIVVAPMLGDKHQGIGILGTF